MPSAAQSKPIEGFFEYALKQWKSMGYVIEPAGPSE